MILERVQQVGLKVANREVLSLRGLSRGDEDDEQANCSHRLLEVGRPVLGAVVATDLPQPLS
ncbi:hypothetical protein ACFRQM_49290 [Streptomyces sp. NPDC056831]|uniref:hypothetical protein n=1 Tax=Streptomyces sp. NPDC056831 TaxID=3345954 RepID=UPI0036B9B465